MDFNKAVQNAMQGDSESFAYLYNNTYCNMLYLTMKYVKNESNAESIVQDSYIKAQTNMNILHEPEKFNSWLGCIVANTAVNFLKKKKPLVFSTIGGEDNNGQSFIYEIQDDNQTYQTEKAYSKEEIKILVREMVDTLSDEQRMCVMMYHFDGQSIHAVADSMGCSENTVKSRLYYGRNELRKKMKSLKEQGYRIYSTAPIPFMIFLLRAEKALPETQKIAKMAMDRHLKNNHFENALKNNSYQTVEETVKETVSEEAEIEKTAEKQSGVKTFFSTLIGKVTAAVLTVIVLGGTAAGLTIANNRMSEAYDNTDSEKTSSKSRRYSDREFLVVSSEAPNESSKTEKEKDTDTMESKFSSYTSPVQSQNEDNNNSQQKEPQKSEQTEWITLNDDDYLSKIRGGLTKEQLELVLTRLDISYCNDQLDNNQIMSLLNCFALEIGGGNTRGFTYNGKDNQGRYLLSVSEMDRMFLSFSNCKVSEVESFHAYTEYGFYIENDVLHVSVATTGDTASVSITNSQYNDYEMIIEYHYVYDRLINNTNLNENRRATLKKTDDGTYRIVNVEVI